MAYDTSDSQVVLFGGFNASGALNHTWVWQDANWTQKDPANSPPKRYVASMAYDAADGKVVLFGGLSSNSSQLSDTWVWNGADWTQEHPAHSPAARAYAGMAYDAMTRNVVLFGGDPAKPAVVFLSDTWVWNGADWKQEHPAHSPAARVVPSMAYDTAAGQVVLFGGLDSSSACLSDTWVWNGTGWKQEHPAHSPSARCSASMAYDETRGQVVLFGGVDANNDEFSDTWLWNGTDWTQVDLSVADTPSARYGAAMVFDEAEGQVVLFGGLGSDDTPSGVLSDTWVWR
jgi:hypothetical protein